MRFAWIGLLMAGLATAGCAKNNALFCDTDNPCTDPARPFCDVDGVFPASEGHGKTCIATPGVADGGVDAGPELDAGPDAMIDAQMIDAAMCGGNVCLGNTPVCNMQTGLCRACGLLPTDCGAGTVCAPSGACVECTMTSQCTTAKAKPVCETSTSMCRGCATPGECAAIDPLTPQCKSNGACVACTAATQCGNGTTPICSPTTDTCVACASGTECAAKDPSLPQCASGGNCVQCTTAVHCGTGMTPICNGTNQCVGCTTPQQCADKNPALPQCAGSGACVQCVTSPQCGTATLPICANNACRGCGNSTECVARGGATPPVCKTTTGACVQCLGNNDCSGTTPVCDTTPNTCRACRQDIECASGVCDEGPGSCTLEANVIYVAPGGTGTACTRLAPCATLTIALAQVTGSRTTILATAGTYTASITVNSTARIIGTGAGVDIEAGGGAPVITVGSGATLTLENGSVFGAGGIHGGIVCNGGGLNLSRVTIRNNAGVGITATSCPVTMDRSGIRLNGEGGVSLVSSGYTITNSFIVDNGRSTAGGSLLGAISIANPPNSPTRFDNNTLTGNVAGAAAGTGGVICPVGVSVPLVNNIVWANSGAVQFVGMCGFTNSDVQGIAAGGGNINMDPLFVNTGGADYHIGATSPCRNAGSNTGATDHDFDGDARPRPGGTNVDIGADEVP
ncbi:MAG: hypothetical protein IT370_01210 [Deltaproteobacteria bacterium]|nr:hypothetical protein [Deltaproteobacteria bacterium]